MIFKLMEDFHTMVVGAASKLTDNEALSSILLFDRWHENTAYEADERIRHEDKLYRVRQGHTSQAIYPPGSTGTESLYEVIDETHAGTLEDPIPYDGNMALENGKYYSQEDVIYLCTRDTVDPVYHPLSALVGHYVEVANG